MTFSSQQISKIVAIFKAIYLLQILLIIVISLFSYFASSGPHLDYLLLLIISSVIVIGIHRVRPWVLPLIVFSSVCSILRWLFENAVNVPQIIVRFTVLLCIIFQLFFFTRKEVGAYFKDKGTTVF